MSAPERMAVYTGVFDPIHNGHLDVIQRGGRLVDRLIVGVGDNPEKVPLFTQPERVELIRQAVAGLADVGNVEVRPFDGLAVHYVRAVGARLMLRGLRTTSDMEYEFAMSLTNLALDPGIETVFLMAREHFSHISGTLLRQIAAFGGDLEPFVPPVIRAPLLQRARERARRS